jgi:integrase
VIQEGERWHFRITDDPETGRRIKTESSRRSVPIHEDLISAGFIDFVRSRNGPLFDVTGAAFSKRWMRWLRVTVGINDGRWTFHSLRHSFKRLCRDSGIPEEIHDQLTGHSSGSVGRSYGRGVSLGRLSTAMNQIAFPVSLEGIAS